MTEFLAEYGEKKPVVVCDRTDCRFVAESGGTLENRPAEYDKYGQMISFSVPKTQTLKCTTCNKTWTREI